MPEPQILVSFDYGQRRIGVALGNALTCTAKPLQTIERKPGSKAYWDDIDQIVEEWRPDRFVLGWPDHEGDQPTQLHNEIKKFRNRLKHRYQIDVDYVNEAYSSCDANQRLKSRRQSGRKQSIQKPELDRLAAAILLESWFSS